ncbi:hypothetical protein [Streptomyces sp. NPDC004250]|uniref:hypothetical protein n=1 Tax=Streptomyces sp. NPDC004250 TaxID=3364692 RepID=UPI0036A8632D
MDHSMSRQQSVQSSEVTARQDEGEEVGDDQYDANANTRETYWETVNKVTMIAAMATLSKGNRSRDNVWRASGVALLSSRLAQMALKELIYKDCHSAMLYALNSTGAAIWSAGFATGGRALHTAGPAVSFTANLISAGMELCQDKEGWWRRAIDAAESGLFTVTGITDSSGARAGALGAAAVGFLADSKQEPNLVGHALGFSVWAAGAGMGDDYLQSVGAGVVAGSELIRLLAPARNKHMEGLPSEAAAQNSHPLRIARHTTPASASQSQARPTGNPIGSSAAVFSPPGLPPIEPGPRFSSMIPESMVAGNSSPVMPVDGNVTSIIEIEGAPRNSSGVTAASAYKSPHGNAERPRKR